MKTLIEANKLAETTLLVLSMTGKINNGVGKNKEDVLGFDYVVKSEKNQCLKYYAANPPQTGLTKPEPIPCPLGIRVIKDYKINYEKAIEIFHTMNCGDAFTDIALSWPLTPEVREPVWHIHTNLGSVVVIGADSGKASCEK